MRSVFSTIAPPWFTSAKHGFRVIDLAEMLCNLMADRIPAISHTEELIVATARSIEGHTLRYGGLHASNPDRRASLLYVPDLLSSSAVPQEPVRAGADAGSGQLIFNNTCRTCHTTKEGDNRLGPNLHNIIGRKAGSLPNFGYSSAMKGADFVWDTGKLDSFIAKPDEVVPGNNMKPYGGLASAEDRTKLIAFLQSPTTD
jgi:cytochrome c